VRSVERLRRLVPTRIHVRVWTSVRVWSSTILDGYAQRIFRFLFQIFTRLSFLIHSLYLSCLFIIIVKKTVYLCKNICLWGIPALCISPYNKFFLRNFKTFACRFIHILVYTFVWYSPNHYILYLLKITKDDFVQIILSLLFSIVINTVIYNRMIFIFVKFNSVFLCCFLFDYFLGNCCIQYRFNETPMIIRLLFVKEI